MTGHCYLSVDLEDYRDATMRAMGLAPRPNPEQTWRGVQALLEVVEGASGAKRITFFATGQVARDQSDLIAYLRRRGHEIACHGDVHENVWDLDRWEFSASIDRAVASIERAAGAQVRGFRAPNFSIDARCPWAHEVLADRGLRYDSSLVACAPRAGGTEWDSISAGGRVLREFPIYVHRIAGRLAVRVIGGTYFRLFPAGTIVNFLRRSAAAGYAPIVYLHPADLDQSFQAVSLSEMRALRLASRLGWATRQRQWAIGTRGAMDKLRRVLKEFTNRGPMGEFVH
jgi:hypothetical protein